MVSFLLCGSRLMFTGKSDFHFMISVSHVEWVARCVLCKGCKHPPTVPRPLPIALPLEVPLLSLQSEKGGLEQTSVNLRLQSKFLTSCPRDSDEVTGSLESVRQKEIETIMKLFALSCKSDHESRALEVARLLPSVETLQVILASHWPIFVILSSHWSELPVSGLTRQNSAQSDTSALVSSLTRDMSGLSASPASLSGRLDTVRCTILFPVSRGNNNSISAPGLHVPR